MINLDKRLELLFSLKNYLETKREEFDQVISKACLENPWFTKSNVTKSLHAICNKYLDERELINAIEKYYIGRSNTKAKKVAIIMAGNIPLVGFQDWLHVFLTGHQAIVKQSDKDKILFSHIVDKMTSWDSSFTNTTQIMNKLNSFDAIIATGSNNSFRYFEYYYGKYPNILRKNRNSIAVLDGTENEIELTNLCADIFDYFGMGCRNVSHLYVPTDYAFDQLLFCTEKLEELSCFEKYRRNYDYQLAIMMLNKELFYQSSNVLLRKSPQYVAPIATLNYSNYEDINDVIDTINQRKDEIQCVVSKHNLNGINTILPGESQLPGLLDFADNIDTLAFLNRISV